MHFLILLPTIPYPPHFNGIALRYYPFLKNLYECGHEITIVVYNMYNHIFADDAMIQLQKTGFRVISAETVQCPNNTFNDVLKVFSQLRGKNAIPFEQYNYSYKQIKYNIHNAVPQGNYDIGIAAHQMFFDILAELPPEKKPARSICDFIDSPLMHFNRRTHTSNNILKKLFFRNIDKLIYPSWERSITLRSDMTLYVSAKDAELLWGPELHPKIHIMPNGIYPPSQVTSSPSSNICKPAFGFIGNMSYQPNHQAALYLISIWQDILKEIPQANLYLIGRNPVSELVKKAKISDTIHITGTVDNIWEYYSSLDMFLCPLQSGAGLQNKILEAMCARVPIVASSIANSGINAVDGKHLIIANLRKGFIEASVDLWRQRAKRERIVNDAYSWVKEKFNWKHITASFLDALKQKLTE